VRRGTRDVVSGDNDHDTRHTGRAMKRLGDENHGPTRPKPAGSTLPVAVGETKPVHVRHSHDDAIAWETLYTLNLFVTKESAEGTPGVRIVVAQYRKLTRDVAAPPST
jgi:hypothetical protein